MPDGLVYSLLAPIVKDKSGVLDDKSNYRAIALSTTLSKVLELILVERLQPFLNTSDAQFGFNLTILQLMLLLLLKRQLITILSKAVQSACAFWMPLKPSTESHTPSFLKFFKVPSPYIKLLIQWHRSQQMGVKWANSSSYSFSVANGVRQGGSSSPILFNVYIDDLTRSLEKMHVGCRVQNRAVNVLAYADDIVLLSPSRGLKKLIRKCETFALSRDIIFNVKKSVCMMFNPGG